MRLATKVLLACLLLQTFSAANGQGHDPGTSKNSSSSNNLGASGAIYRQLGTLYKRVKETKSMYRALHAQAATPCSGGQQGVLCAANAADLELQDVLLMAASPAVFDARNDSFYTNPISPPGDQGTCNSCVGFAVAAAAEAAVANVLAVKGSDVTLSAQDLQFCAVDDKGNVKPARGCPSPWNLRDGLERLRMQPPVRASCLPYHAPHIEDKTLCSYCENNDRNASQGSFTSVALASFVDVQLAIRENGGVATAVYVNIAHMRGFFAAKPKGIYTGSPANMSTQGHAVFVVGYSNLDNFWLVKNSFGTGFADGGFMRVAYNTSGIMLPDETVKVIFTPKTPQTTQLLVAADPKNRTGCFVYTAQPKDYMARVARAAGVSIQQFLLDNTGVVKDLDKPITGLLLRVCNPAPNTIVPPDDLSAALLMAASPRAYSSINPKQAGLVRLVATPQDQGLCSSVVAFTVAAAAETAMAAVLRVPVQDCSISVQSLYFCPVAGPARTCESGWNLPEALTELQQRSSRLPTADCLPYRPDFKSEMTRAELCEGSCSYANKYANQGRFSSRRIEGILEAQRHIRQYGAVVAHFDVYSDFRPFFDNVFNSAAIYKPSPDALFQFAHAVVLVGYNNDEKYWIAKNSWGPDWGDGGFFKLAFFVCGVLDGASEAYGIIWTPNQPVPTTQLPVTSAAPQYPGCFWYKAGPADYLSRVASLAGIPLHQFMLDNSSIVKDLDAPLTGLQLLLCKPKPGTTKLV